MVAFLSPVMILSGGPITLTLVGTNGTASGTVSLPGSPAAGDIAVYLQYVRDTGLTLGVPSGYTQVAAETTSADAQAQAGYKILTGGETQIATGTSGTTSCGTYCKVYRPSRSISAVTPSTWNKEFTNGNPSSQTVNPSALAGPVLVFAGAGSNSSAFSFSTASPAFDLVTDVDITNGYSIFGAKLYDTSPLSHSVDMIDEGGDNILISGYLAIS